MNKRKLIIILVAIIVFFITIFLIKISQGLYSTYDFGDTGVSITVFNKFQKFDDKKAKTDVSLYNSELKTYIVGRDLPDGFWASGDLHANCDEYVRTISAMYYDRDIKDVGIDTIKINGEEVGKVSMTTSQKNTSYRSISLLCPKANKNLIIEIYGDTKVVGNNNDKMEDIISGIHIKK